MEKIFRAVLVATTLAYILFYFQPVFYKQLLTIDQQYMVLNAGGWAHIWLPPLFWHFIFIAFILTSIGLFFFKPMARTVFLFLNIFTLVITPFNGFQVFPPIDALLLQTINLADGFLLALMYFTSIGKRFKSGDYQLSSQGAE